MNTKVIAYWVYVGTIVSRMTAVVSHMTTASICHRGLMRRISDWMERQKKETDDCRQGV